MAVDLHTHSIFSDGSDPPARVVEEAARRGLTAVALTDHDTLDGIAEARATATEVGIELIPGVELSVDWLGGSMHLLVYHLEPGPGPLQDHLDELRRGRSDRNQEMVEALRDLGIDITHHELDAEAMGRGAGRPHMAALLVRKGVVADMASAFDQYLGTGRPAYRDRPRLDYRAAIDLAKASGAVPVVAHPHTLGVSAAEYRKALLSAAEAGVAGIECYYGEYTPDERDHLARLATDLGLVATGGSDYHGRYKPDVELGIGRGDLEVPDTPVHQLRALRGRGD